MATRISIDGKRWALADPLAIVLAYDHTEPNKRPLLLRGCERCAAICGFIIKCRCCANHKQRTSGGSPSCYPEDGLHHVTLMPMERFVATLRERIA